MTEARIRTPDQRLRVFISSTLQELAPERAAAREAVSRLRLSPVAFEAGARPHPPKDLYRAYLAQSDIFIGIYWQRYGWVAPGMDVSGLEDEYELARAHPKLIYVKDPAPEREPQLKELLRRVQEDDRVSYKRFSTPDELRELVENDLALTLTERFDESRAHTPDRAIDDAPASALPAALTRFFGREREQEQLRQLLADPQTRLVTLVGPGGVGKTRLALEAAGAAAAGFPGGVVFVSLAPISDTEMILPAIARALDVREAGGRPISDAIEDRVRASAALIVLDNFEHLVRGAPVVSDLLTRAPLLKALVTSREPLALQGEQQVVIAPLPVERSPETAAVALFADRARAVDATFELNGDNIQAVAELCRRLDGLPLAIELAAARVSMLSPSAMLERLEDVLALAGQGGRDLPERQRTLRSAVDWSFQLLSETEHRLIESLSAFAGRITPEAASTICEIDGDLAALEALDSLARKSLLFRERRNRSVQFRMLNSVRAFARERLAASGERDAVEQRYAAHFIALVERAQPMLFSGEHMQWRDLLDDEYENLRAVLEASESNAAAMAKLIYDLQFFWYRRGLLSEGRRWADGALIHARPSGHDRGMIINGAGSIAMWQGDLAVARERYEEAAALLADSPDTHLRGASQFTLGVIMVTQGDVNALTHLQRALAILGPSSETRDQYFAALSLMHMANFGMSISRAPEAVGWLNTALDASRRIGDGWLIASVLSNMGEVARGEGDYERAATGYQEALAQFEQADAMGDAARLLCCLAFVACHAGDPERGTPMLDRALSLHQASGSKRGVAECLLGYARVLSERARAAADASSLAWRAAMLLGAAEERMRAQDAIWWPADVPERDAAHAAIAALLPDADREAALREGAGLSIEQAREVVLG